MARPDLRAPSDIAQAFGQAVELFRQGKLEDAERIAVRLQKSLPGNFDALHLLGVIRLQRGKAAAALPLIEKAVALNPGSADARTNLGLALGSLNRGAEALASFDRALAMAPDSVDAINNRGTLLLRLDRPAEALAAFERVAVLAPQHLGARINQANALAMLGRLDEALTHYDTLLAALPTHADLHFNRGNALLQLGRYDDAIAAFDQALSLRPDHLKAQLNRGSALQALNRHQDALASFASVLAADRHNADAQHNAALSHLTLGDFRRGFAQHEARWQRTGMPARRRSLGKPLWLGEFPPARKTVLLHAEQGLGDTIQFARYATLLARMGAKVVLEAPRELVGLLSRIDGVTAVVASGDPLPAFDLHCPVASLPLACRTELATIPADSPYLKADDAHVARWRARLDALPAPRVAIAWSGRVTHANDRNRSIVLERLAPLIERSRASFISIQRDLRETDADVLARLPQVTHVGAELDDFEDSAAVATLADLVIAVDTAVAHLAGALGRPTWILLPFCPDWRWMLDRDDSPWYPTVRLFRQPVPGDWDSVITRVEQELVRQNAQG